MQKRAACAFVVSLLLTSLHPEISFLPFEFGQNACVAAAVGDSNRLLERSAVRLNNSSCTTPIILLAASAAYRTALSCFLVSL